MPVYAQDDKINKFALRIPDSLYSKLRKISYESRESINKIILEAIKEYIK